MPGGERACSPRRCSLFERFDLTGDADAPVGVTAGTARVGDEERGRGSGPVRGPLTRPVERAQPARDLRVEPSAGPFQREELLANRPEPEVHGVEFVDRFVQTLDRRIHAGNLPEHTFDTQAQKAENLEKIGLGELSQPGRPCLDTSLADA